MVYPASSRAVCGTVLGGVKIIGGFFLVCLMALAQYPQTYPPGGYPPGGYPPGTYPPGTYPPGTYPNGRGVPVPSKGGTKTQDPKAPLPNYRGNLTQMDEKTITIEMEDHRNLQFTRNGKTKFFKNGEELKSPKFAIGDQLSVEGPTDPAGFLTAVNVYWEKAATPTTASSTARPDTRTGVDAWKDDPKKDANAKRFEHLTYDQVIERKLAVMDTAAIALCRDHKVPLRIYDMSRDGDLMRIIRGEPIGTLVS